METIMLNPRQYKIPDWFLNRQKDWKDGTFGQCISNGLDTKLREDLERLKKVKRHFLEFWCKIINLDPCSSWSPSSLASPCPWSTYQDHWSTWTYRRCCQEEVNTFSRTVINQTITQGISFVSFAYLCLAYSDLVGES